MIWKMVVVLIETLWNVKFLSYRFNLWHFAVLIETLWNVKQAGIRVGLCGWFTVLIETLWNVKVVKHNTVQQRRRSINRNIVECKGGKHTGSKWNVVSINRNIVECKALSLCKKHKTPSSY